MPNARARVRACAALAVCLALLLPTRAAAQTRAPGSAEAAAPAPVGEPSAADLERVALLLRQLSGARPASPESVAMRIKSLGPEALPGVLSTLAADRWARSIDPRKPEVVPLGDLERRTLQYAVEGCGRAAVLDLVRAALVPESAPAVRLAALTGLGLAGRAEDLDLALALVRAEGAGNAWGQRMLEALARAVERILRRDATAVRAAVQHVGPCSAAEAGALIRGCAACGRPEALTELGALAHKNAPWTPLLLPELVRAARHAPRPIDARLLADVRAHLDCTDVAVARAAAMASAGLGDFEIAPALIEMLDSDTPLLREAARVGLQALTGLTLEGGTRAWSRWLQAEREWFEANAPACLRDLGTGSLGRRTAALGDLAGHRYRREELASAVEATLADPAPEVRRLACGVLAGLGCGSSARALADLLEDPDPAVARAAWDALTRLTGKHLAPERARWIAALDA